MCLLIETQQDLLAIKCAIAAANRAMSELGRIVPIMVQASFDTNAGQQMLTGSDPSALVAAIEPYDGSRFARGQLRVRSVRTD